LTIIALVVMADTYVVDMRVLVSDDDDDNESLCNESTTGDEEHDKGADGAGDAVDIAVLPFDVSEDSDDNDEGLIDESTNTDDEERDTIAATANAEDESRFDKPTTTERPTYQNILSIWHYPTRVDLINRRQPNDQRTRIYFQYGIIHSMRHPIGGINVHLHQFLLTYAWKNRATSTSATMNNFPGYPIGHYHFQRNLSENMDSLTYIP